MTRSTPFSWAGAMFSCLALALVLASSLSATGAHAYAAACARSPDSSSSTSPSSSSSGSVVASRSQLRLPVSAASNFSSSSSSSNALPDLYNATIAQLQQGLDAGSFTSVDLVKAYLARIREVNGEVHAVIETAPDQLVLAAAAAMDEERKQGKKRGELHGIPIIVKDNIATEPALGMNTTAGSFALLGSVVPGDSPIVASLRQAGAVIIAKANMSVWAQIRGDLTQGWSPRGGFTTSALYKGGNACSSSSGSGVSASIGLAAATLGSETDGSIVCPASRNSVVGVKPTIGLASRFGVVPISASQDSAGPIVRTVDDAAVLLTYMATRGGADSAAARLDAATAQQPAEVAKGIDYVGQLRALAQDQQERPLEGVRIGATRGVFLNATSAGFDEGVVGIYEEALATLVDAGATLVNVTLELAQNETALASVLDAETIVLNTELQQSMSTYLSYLKDIPSASYSLGGLIEFANMHPDLELPTSPSNETDQSTFYEALRSPYYAPLEPGADGLALANRTLNATYASAIATAKLAGAAIDSALADNSVETLVAPSDSFLYSLAAISGHPAASVPAGFLGNDVKSDGTSRPVWPFSNAPAGLNFVTYRWNETSLLRAARGFEVAQIRKGKGGYGEKRSYKEATPTTQLADVVSKQ